MWLNRFRFSFCLLALVSCNSSGSGNYQISTSNLDGVPLQLRIEEEPSSSSISGECLADTLSFLVGQPETALAALEYPANTRVLGVGSISDDNDPSRLNIVIGIEKKIINIYCG